MRRLSPSLAGLALLVALVGAWALSPGVVRQVLRERAFDLLLPLLPHGAAGDRPAWSSSISTAHRLARFGAWPWPRERLAELVAAVAAGKPAALALDILLAGPDRFVGGRRRSAGAGAVGGAVCARVRAGDRQRRPGPADDTHTVSYRGVAARSVAGQWRDRAGAAARRCRPGPWRPGGGGRSRRPDPPRAAAGHGGRKRRGPAWRSRRSGSRTGSARC